MSGDAAYRLGAGTWRGAAGRILIGGRPPRRIRLSEAGVALLDAALAGRPTRDATDFVARLRDYGLLDPVVGTTKAEVTFVVPARDGGPQLAALVGDLLPYGSVIVVDDGSRDDSPEAARLAGASVVPNSHEPGPAGARNTGWKLADTEFIAFVDADCLVRGDWARPLAGLLLADPRLALVAPRIRGAGGTARLARWDRLRSPLDMGARGGLVGPGRLVSFVPSAALIARRSALVDLGGFDTALRFGEDVDLVWRAVAARWSVRYAPEIEIEHPARPDLIARARQHFEYGTSAAALERRHPGQVAPLRWNRLMLPVAALATGSTAASFLAAGALTARAASKHADPQVRLAVSRLALQGQLEAATGFGRALSREWLPLTLLAATRRRRARRLALVTLAVDLTGATVRDPRAAPINAALRIADNAAYCAGLWHGALAQRSARALLPRWERRSAATRSAPRRW